MTLAQRAEAARNSLFQRYDALNALYVEAEKELTRHHIPRDVEYQYAFEDSLYEGQSTGCGYGSALGIQKWQGKWRLCHSTYYYPDEYCQDGATWTPIVECSGEQRVRAAGHILKLREKVVESSEDFVKKTDEAIATLRKSVESLKNDDLAKLLAERAKLNGSAG